MKMPSIPGFSVMSMFNKLMKPAEGLSGGSMQEQLENQAQANERRNRADRRRAEREEQRANRDVIRAEKDRERAVKERDLFVKRHEQDLKRARAEGRREANREARYDKQTLREEAAEERRVKRLLSEERRNQARNIQAEKQRQREASRQQRIEKEQKVVSRREDRKKVSRIRKELGDAGYKKAKWAKNVEWLQKIEDERRRAEKEAELMESVREQGHFVFQTTRMGNGWVEIKDTDSIKGELMDELDEYDRPSWSEDETNNLFK